MSSYRFTVRLLASAALVALASTAALPALDQTTRLNFSCDPTRELYQDVNAAFARQ